MYNFNHVIFLMNRVTCLNNTYEESYKLPHSGLEEIASKWIEAKLSPCLIVYLFFSYLSGLTMKAIPYYVYLIDQIIAMCSLSHTHTLNTHTACEN